MSIFEQLKRTSDFTKTPLSARAVDVRFQLNFDEKGAYVEVTDVKGKPVELDFLQYSGILRALVKSIQTIQERNYFTIDWENPENRTYLFEHPYLVEQLLASQRFTTEKRKVISFDPDPVKLVLVINRSDEDLFSASFKSKSLEQEILNFQFIAEEYVLNPDRNTVSKSEPVGSLFNNLSAFNSNDVALADLEKYLSLSYSYVQNFDLAFEDYQVERRLGQVLQVKPAIIFEKVNQDNELYLRVSQVLPNQDLDFLQQYDLTHFATLNEMEKKVLVRPLEQLPLELSIAQLRKMILAHVPKKERNELNFIQEDDLFIIPEKLATKLVFEDIPKLIGQYVLIGSEHLKQYKINIKQPKLNLQLNHGIDFLAGDASLDFGDQSIGLAEALSQYQKQKYIILADGSHALINEKYMQRLQRLFKKKKDKVEISFFDIPLVEELIEERVAGEQFSFAREIFQGFNQIAKSKAKLPKIKATLRPYQHQGFLWLKYLYDNKLGGCLADDMGLGKTIQTICLLAHIYEKNKATAASLVVMPRTLLHNWENEINKFAPHLSYYIWSGNQRDIGQASSCNIILTTYGLLRSDIETWQEQQFYYLVLDESQAIKNLQSQVHKAVMLIQSNHRLSLSGTPVENNLAELYALFRFLNPAMFGNPQDFNKKYLYPIQKDDDKEAVRQLRKKIYPFILRRLKKDVAKELPDKIEQTLYVEMNKKQSQYYEQRRRFYKEAISQQVATKGISQTQFFIFQALNELRQIASIPEAPSDNRIISSKIEFLLEQMDDALANRHKVLVFCNFLAAVEHLGEALIERGVDFVTMTGSTRNRQQLVDRFQQDQNCRVFIMTLKTGGTGLNLTAADMVFIFDPWWNKAAENQAIDRTHRIGQDKKVFSYKLVCLGTIEEKIIQLQEKKSELFENLIASDSASVKSLSEEDVEFIMGE